MKTMGSAGRFGATMLEARMPLPGDDVVPIPMLETTHAITIDAPAERIWRWLVQIGQERAGFYSDSMWWDQAVDFYYRLLSREQGRARVRYQKRDTNIVSDWQELHVGDAILDGPPGTAFYVVRQVAPNRSLVLFSDTHLPYLLPRRLRNRVSAELTAAYLLVPLPDGTTRVIRRMRMTCRPLWFRLLVVPGVWMWGEWITARKLLQGLKRRAENRKESNAASAASRSVGEA
jgi:hypothetical protein